MSATVDLSARTEFPPDPPDRFEDRLRRIGALGYHHRHPFHVMMHEGQLNKRQLQGWIENRFYYQGMIPRKDAAILAKTNDVSFRRAWITRITDHDGGNGREGGIRKWLRMAAAAGLDPEEVSAMRLVLPVTRFAVDAYLRLVERSSLSAAVASSLTELFAPTLMTQRVAALEQCYTWLAPQALDYFKARIVEAPRDADFGLQYVLEHCITRASQDEAASALKEKCHILWSVLDAIYFAYVSPGFFPPFWQDRNHE